MVFTTLVIAPLIPTFIKWNLKKIKETIDDDHRSKNDSDIVKGKLRTGVDKVYSNIEE